MENEKRELSLREQVNKTAKDNLKEISKAIEEGHNAARIEALAKSLTAIAEFEKAYKR